ncbi:MAG: 3-deoxy-D-manno-octulosonic acid transferase, partial [Gammaproteobacteria bacterium]
VTGSLKFDIQIPASIYEEGAALRRDLGVDRPVWMAGSTRPREEASILDALAQLKTRYPNLLLVLAPRHPERFQEVHALCKHRGRNVQRRSRGTECEAKIDILLLDSMGELMRFYAASDIAFVGGSLAAFGGHNVLEPAGLGIPVVTGPHLFNFSDIASKLFASGSLKVGHTIDEITDLVAGWLDDSEARDAAGRNGRRIVEANRGASKRIIALLEASL